LKRNLCGHIALHERGLYCPGRETDWKHSSISETGLMQEIIGGTTVFVMCNKTKTILSLNNSLIILNATLFKIKQHSFKCQYVFLIKPTDALISQIYYG
jgi:hypothetical protein